MQAFGLSLYPGKSSILELNTGKKIDKLKSQATILPQDNMSSNSNTITGSIKDLQNISKKTGPIIGNSYGIDSILEHIDIVKGVRLIHNGKVKKELAVDKQTKMNEGLRITKSEFAKL
jgi:hypothetical protein